jgi:hypothetical protein
MRILLEEKLAFEIQFFRWFTSWYERKQHGKMDMKEKKMNHFHLSRNLGESTANDVSPYMDWTCPRILFFTTSDLAHNGISLFVSLFFTSHTGTSMTCWRPTTGRLLPSNYSRISFPQVLPGLPLGLLTSDSRAFFHRCASHLPELPY